MRMTGTQITRNLWRQVARASSAALYLVLMLTVTAFASTITISDQAGVLNQSQVRKAASALGYPVSVYTMNGFSGSTQQFNHHVANLTASHRDMVVIAIDTNRRYVVVRSGPDVPLTTTDTIHARQAFIKSFNGGDYTAATVNSLNSLKGSLAAQGALSGINNKNGGWFRTGTCLLGLLLIGGLLFFVLRRNKSRSALAEGRGVGGLFGRRRPVTPEYTPPYQSNVPPYRSDVPPYQGNTPPYQGYNPPNYGPDNPPQPKGMNPLAAGGLGAAAGGLLGYELGKMQGNRDRQDEGNREAGGDFGEGDAGSGSGGYFGGGDTGSGSGGDFGGDGDVGSGSGGYFGGGDIGSGSGGDFGGDEDAGSGSGGNF